MTEDNEIRDLADLNVASVRRENPHVDEKISDLEEKASEAESDLAEAESERDSYKERAEQAEKLLEQVRDTQRAEQIKRINEANEAVETEDEVDLETLEDATVSQLETVANLLEAAVGAGTEVSNADDEPNLGGASAEGTDSISNRMAELAEDMGHGEAFEAAVNGDDDGFAKPEAAGSGGAGPDAAEVAQEIIERGEF